MKPDFELLDTREQISGYITLTQNTLINSCYRLGAKEFSKNLKFNLIEELKKEESFAGVISSAAVLSVINKTLDEMGVE